MMWSILIYFPAAEEQISQYEYRNSRNLFILSSVASIFAHPCIPSSITAWNEHDMQFCSSESYSSFCYELKKKHHCAACCTKVRKLIDCGILLATYNMTFIKIIWEKFLFVCLKENIGNAVHFFFEWPRYNINKIGRDFFSLLRKLVILTWPMMKISYFSIRFENSMMEDVSASDWICD